MQKLISYLRLFRLANCFSAISNVMMGYLVVADAWDPFPLVLLLISSSWCLFTAGMVLNDVFDFDRDSRQRPERPLPSGQISVATARRLGFGLLAAGVLMASTAGWVAHTLGVPTVAWKPAAVATALAMMVLIYDCGAKRTAWGPISMGACRTLNVLLGMSGVLPENATNVLGFAPHAWWIALTIGVYVAGVTLLARREAETSDRASLLASLGIIAASFVMLAGIGPWGLVGDHLFLGASSRWVWPVFVCVFSLPVLRRCLLAVIDPQPYKVQAAVVTCLFSMILIDAAICLLVAPPVFGLVVAGLLLPSLVLARWIRVT